MVVDTSTFPIRIYLCGSVRKGGDDSRDADDFWSADHERFIESAISPKVELLNPSKTRISRSDYFVNFGCDIFLLRSSQLMLADLRSERGIGVGAELMFAKQVGIPVISWLPVESHYRRDLSDVFGEDLNDWIHPFAFSLSDYIEDSLEAVCKRANFVLSESIPKLDRNKTIEEAIERFIACYPDFRN